jgi:hypothetical protein
VRLTTEQTPEALEVRSEKYESAKMLVLMEGAVVFVSVPAARTEIEGTIRIVTGSK